MNKLKTKNLRFIIYSRLMGVSYMSSHLKWTYLRIIQS